MATLVSAREERFARVFAQFAAHHFIQLLHHGVLQQARMCRNEFVAAGFRREIRQLAQQFVGQRSLLVFWLHANPVSSRRLRSRSRHRCRMNPIEPTAIPSVAAIS